MAKSALVLLSTFFCCNYIKVNIELKPFTSEIEVSRV